MRKRLIFIMLLLSLTGRQSNAAQTPETEPTKPASTSPTAPVSPANPSAQSPPPLPAQVQALPINEAAGIMGRPIHGGDGKGLGSIIDVIVDQNGQPRAAVIDFGGFLGLGNRKIAVNWSALHFSPGNQTAPVTLDLTPDQIKAAPEYREVGKAPPTVVAAPALPPPALPPPALLQEDKPNRGAPP